MGVSVAEVTDQTAMSLAAQDLGPCSLDRGGCDRLGMSRVVALVLAVGLLAGACASDATVVGSGQPVPGSASVLNVEQVAPDLVYLGGLAEVTSSQSEVFDEAGGALRLSSDSVVEVPAGAFGVATELRATEIELVFDQYATGAPRAWVYRLSTSGEIELGAPVVLDVGTAPATVAVIRLVDGSWQPVEVEAGATTRIQIDRFSDVTIPVGERVEDKPIFNNADPRPSLAKNFLTSCIQTVAQLTDSALDLGEWDDGINPAAYLFAYKYCVRALVDKYSPPGVTVEVCCVGDKIEQIEPGRFGLGAAIDACVDKDGTDAEAQEPVPPIGLPRTYRGQGTHILRTFNYGVAIVCETPGPMELRLAADGSATFTYFNGAGVVGTISDDGTPQIDCVPSDGNTWTGTYDPESLVFEIASPAPEGIEAWNIGGTFDADTAVLLGGCSLPPNPAGEALVVEIDAFLER